MKRELRLSDSVEVLRRTPGVLRALLTDIPESLLLADEGPETWCPFDVVGHLIHGERTDWIPRANQILSGDSDKPFPPFDRTAHFDESEGKSIGALLDEFERSRGVSLQALEGFGLEESDLERTGTHPEFGSVTLGQLLATWVTHDLSHLAQIARVMAKAHGNAVGPWAAYLSILNR